MATAEERAAILALLIQILREPAGTSVDLLARLANAFPGREAVIADVINKFLQGDRHDRNALHNKLYESAIKRILDGTETHPNSMVVPALPRALERAVMDFFERLGINVKVDRDKLLNQLAFSLKKRSPEIQGLYATFKARLSTPRVLNHRPATTISSKVIRGGQSQAFGTTSGGMIQATATGGGAVGGGGPDHKTRVEGVQRGDGQASRQESDAKQEEILRLLRGLDLKVEAGLKRNAEETEEVRKRVRTLEDHDVAVDMELGNLRTDLSNVNQQLANLTSAVLGALAGRRVIVAGGGGGAMGGLLGFGSGGGRASPPSTSVLPHTTRPTLPRTAAPPRPSADFVDLSLDEDDEEEEEDKVGKGSTGADETKGNEE